MTPDVNVLVAASRADHPHHAQALTWLEAALPQSPDGPPLVLMPMAVASFLRLVTSPKIFTAPTPIEQAISFVDALLVSPGVHIPTLGAEWLLQRTLCLQRVLTGNALPDAWLAAAVEHHREHLVTFDRDFRKLLGRGRLTVLVPAAGND